MPVRFRALGALPINLTSLDLRYNELNLATPTTLSLSVRSVLLRSFICMATLPPILRQSGQLKLGRISWHALKSGLAAPVGLVQAESITNLAKAEQAIDQSLDYLPLEIYDYVHNDYQFQLYDGVMKGTLGVIETHAGNDVELAQLLKGLLDQLNSVYQLNSVTGSQVTVTSHLAATNFAQNAVASILALPMSSNGLASSRRLQRKNYWI